MKFLHYLRYFFYIGFNWNFRLAFFTLRHEIRGEKKYGIETSKLNDLQKLNITGDNLKYAEIYQGANYYLLEKMFSYLQSINANQNIIDFGCGKGRVLAVAAYYGFNKITGIEFASELCDIARQNVAPLKEKFRDKIISVININAIDYSIEDDANVFFFFNPFNHVVMLAVVKNILRSLKNNEREICVIYVNPVHKEIFLSAGFEEIHYLRRLEYAEASILMKPVLS